MAKMGFELLTGLFFDVPNVAWFVHVHPCTWMPLEEVRKTPWHYLACSGVLIHQFNWENSLKKVWEQSLLFHSFTSALQHSFSLWCTSYFFFKNFNDSCDGFFLLLFIGVQHWNRKTERLAEKVDIWARVWPHNLFEMFGKWTGRD